MLTRFSPLRFFQ